MVLFLIQPQEPSRLYVGALENTQLDPVVLAELNGAEDIAIDALHGYDIIGVLILEIVESLHLKEIQEAHCVPY